MALIFVDGCDSYAAYTDVIQKWEWTASTTYGQIATTGGRFGGPAIQTRVSANTYVGGKSFPLTGSASSTDEFFFGVSMLLSAAPTSTSVAFAFHNSTPSLASAAWNSADALTNLTLRITNTRQLAIYRGTTLLATGSTILNLNAWFRLEVRIVVSNTGIFDVRLNGVAEITFSGDTYDTGDLGIRQVAFCAPSGSSPACIYDDFVVWNSVARAVEPTTWIGDMRIDTLRPTANGDTINSTPLSGAAYAAVDDVVSDGDTTYTEAATVGNKDLYQVTDLSVVPNAIYAVVVNTITKTTGTSGRQIKAKIKRSSEGDGVTRNVPLSAYGLQQDAFSFDPSTLNFWDAAGVNAMQIGWEVVT